jgi:hypothetical protein
MVPIAGAGITWISLKVESVPQELVTVYTILAVPTETAVTTPVAETVATDVLLLLQVLVPTEVVLVYVEVAEIQMVSAPTIVPAFGAGLTVIVTLSDLDPQTFVFVKYTLPVPGVTPVTTPPEVTLTAPVADQVPVVELSVRVIEAYWHKGPAPKIGPTIGSGVTLKDLVVNAEPHELVTV